MARTKIFRKYPAAGIILFIILVMACGGPTGNSSNRNPQPVQKAPASGAGPTGQTGVSQPQGHQAPYVSDEVLVKFKTDADPDTIERIQAALNLETIRKFSSPNLFLMKITDGSSVEAVIERLKSYEAVKYAEPNYVVKATQ